MKFLLIVLILSISVTFYAESKNILILTTQFVNKGSSELDYVGDLMQIGIYSSFKNIEGYKTLNPIEYNEIINSLKNSDFSDDFEQYLSVGKILNCDCVIYGSYYNEGEDIIFEFNVIDVNGKNLLGKGTRRGSGGLLIFETLDTITTFLIDMFSKNIKEYVKLTIKSDKECLIYANNKLLKDENNQFVIEKGSYWLKCLLPENQIVVYEQICDLSSDTELNIKTFSKLTINSPVGSNIYLNNELKGVVPIELEIPSGNDYKLKIGFNYNGKEFFREQNITTRDYKDKQYDFSTDGELEIKNDNNNFEIVIQDQKGETISSFKQFLNGYYNISVFLNDVEWKNRILLFNNKIDIPPFEKKVFNTSTIKYKPMWGYCMIPGGSQLYNKQNIKGSIIISSFSAFSLFTFLSPLIGYAFYVNDYLKKVNDWNTLGIGSGLKPIDIENSYNNAGYIFIGCLVGGIVATLIVWIYSITDGFINTNHINHLVNGTISDNKNLKVNFEIRM
ncbi:MAG TPA: hypothetical protein PK771_09960 [Spirochaetota bacterium]|nr:hypothetical protein [Spirochaetota bacterium]